MNRNKPDITPDTKVADLLKYYPELEADILQFSPAFAALKNPVLRRTVAKVTSLQQAAKVGNVSVITMVNALRESAGLPSLEDNFCPDGNNIRIALSQDAPETHVTYTLDVRPVIEQGEHPKEAVLRAADKLQPGECLEFIAPFPPIPLIDLLKKKGFKVTMPSPEGGKARTFVERIQPQ